MAAGHFLVWEFHTSKKYIKNIMGKEYKKQWAPWEHVFYYNPKSLHVLFEKLEMKEMSVDSVLCYKRELSVKEIGRRIGFRCLRRIPLLSPQISAWIRF